MQPVLGRHVAQLTRFSLVLCATCVVFAAVAASASAATVPCSAIGGGRFNCSFYPAGDGISGGAPVQASDGHRVGYLNQGTNFVLCQAVGSEVSVGADRNRYWAYTEANDKAYGWVNAVWAHGGTNDAPYGGVPTCPASRGRAPGAAAHVPRRPPTPKPAPPSGSVLPEPVNMGSYGTYHLRYPLLRKSTKHRRRNLTDWTPEQMMSQLNTNFTHYFTFSGCGRHLHVGQRCSLDTTLAPNGPVRVIAISASGFALRSLGGHPEGAGRTIRFEFQTYTDVVETSSMSLEVEAWGPLGGSSLLGELNSKFIADHAWTTFAHNITKRFPDTPPGGVCTPNGCEA
jgi:hypothetical protein